jgi:transposase
MRALFGCGTPREAAGASQAVVFVLQADAMLVIAFIGELRATETTTSSPGW